MGRLLQAAEQQGILDAHLVVVRHTQYCSDSWSDDGGEDPIQSPYCAHSWRTLEGIDRGWEADVVNVYQSDKILQVDNSPPQPDCKLHHQLAVHVQVSVAVVVSMTVPQHLCFRPVVVECSWFLKCSDGNMSIS